MCCSKCRRCERDSYRIREGKQQVQCGNTRTAEGKESTLLQGMVLTITTGKTGSDVPLTMYRNPSSPGLYQMLMPRNNILHA
eukprot:5669338-Pyramimonas_sp.AAC.1